MTTHHVNQPAFEGPLDLLLRLIEQDMLDITTVSLAQVTDRYVAQVKALPQQNLDELTEFLVIAARLLLLKSRVLLPTEPTRQEDEVADDLVARLAEYQLYKTLAAELEQSLGSAERAFGKPAIDEPPATLLVTDGVSLSALQTALQTVLTRLPEERAERPAVLAEHVTIEECIAEIKSRVGQTGAGFETLFTGMVSRVRMIVTFLALLELLKQRLLAVADRRGSLSVYVPERQPA